MIVLFVNSLIQMMGDKYLLSEVEQYFADTLVNENISDLELEHIEKIGGWVSVLDEQLKVIDTTNPKEVSKYTQYELLDLTKGKLIREGERIYGSMNHFIDQLGKRKIGIVCIPAKHIRITHTLVNVKNNILPILILYISGGLLILAGYSLTVYSLSFYMKKRLTDPIHKLINGFYQVGKGHYNIKMDFDGLVEFIEIKKSFHNMVKQLEDMKQEQERLYAQRQQLFADIGHDLKTPITIIQGYSFALQGENVSNEQKEQWIRMIYQNAKNMGELTELLLDYTRFDCTDYKLMKVKCDLTEYVRTILIEKIYLFEEKQMNLKIDIPDEKIEVELDVQILKRAIHNLLNNILEHNPVGIDVYICVKKNKQMIIADSGVEIADNIKNKIFEPFVCGDETRNIDKHNSGLGLSIAKKVIELHNGNLYLIQTWNEYTKAFVIEL